MNICLISTEFPPETGWGGIGSYCWELAWGLRDLGHDVDVISLSPNSVNKRYIAPNLAVHRIPNLPQSNVYRFQRKWGIKQRNIMGRYGILFNAMAWSVNSARYVKKLLKQKLFDIIECPEYMAQGYWIQKITTIPIAIKLHTPFGLAYKLNGNRPYLPINLLSRIEK